MDASPDVLPTPDRRRVPSPPRHGRSALLLGAALAIAILAGSLRHGAAAPSSTVDQIRGPIGSTGCVQCHEKELEAWQKTHHFNSKKVLFSKEGRAVVQKLGLKGLPHKQALCQTCHVTLYSQGGAAKPQVKWGVSCESCHGPSRDWIEVHGKLSPFKTVEEETPAHRQERLATAAAKGMIRPSAIFRLASNCFGCHTVPQETLVNKGGHTAGSAEFELLSWSQGEVRHRFLRGNGNKEAPPARRRILYVVGQMADACGSLRALAQATTDGPFAKAMVKRCTDAKARLGKIADALGDGEAATAVKEVAAAVADDALHPDNADALMKAADEIQTKGEAFAAKYQGGEALAKVDPLLPTKTHGTPLLN
jgi:hypothetical protein